jgi:hypothetical protein
MKRIKGYYRCKPHSRKRIKINGYTKPGKRKGVIIRVRRKRRKKII